MPVSGRSHTRDLLAELHAEQCAHGATLRMLDESQAEVARLRLMLCQIRDGAFDGQRDQWWYQLAVRALNAS